MNDIDAPPYRCPICWALGDDDPSPAWRIERRGDAATTWACDGHLIDEVIRLQRIGYVNELIVRPSSVGPSQEADQ